MSFLIRFFKSRIGLFVLFCISILVTSITVSAIVSDPFRRFYWLAIWWGLPLGFMLIWTRYDHFNVAREKLTLTNIDDWWESRERRHVRQKFLFYIMLAGPLPLIWLYNLNASLSGSSRRIRIPEFIKQPTIFKGSNTTERVRDMLRRVRYKQYVYLIQSNTSGLYKIGFTKNPTRRLLQIKQQLDVDDLDYVCIIETDNMRKLERDLHTKFVKKRLEGEWFDLDEDEVEHIIALSTKQIESTTH